VLDTMSQTVEAGLQGKLQEWHQLVLLLVPL